MIRTSNSRVSAVGPLGDGVDYFDLPLSLYDQAEQWLGARPQVTTWIPTLAMSKFDCHANADHCAARYGGTARFCWHVYASADRIFAAGHSVWMPVGGIPVDCTQCAVFDVRRTKRTTIVLLPPIAHVPQNLPNAWLHGPLSVAIRSPGTGSSAA